MLALSRRRHPWSTSLLVALLAIASGTRQAYAEDDLIHTARTPGLKGKVVPYVLPSIWEGGGTVASDSFRQTFTAGSTYFVGGYYEEWASDEPRPEGWLDEFSWRGDAENVLFFGVGLALGTETARSTIGDETGASFVGGYLHLGGESLFDEGVFFDRMIVVGARYSLRDGDMVAIFDDSYPCQAEIIYRQAVRLDDSFSIGIRSVYDVGNEKLPWRVAVGLDISANLG